MKEKADVKKIVDSLRKLNHMSPNSFTGVEIAKVVNVKPCRIKVNNEVIYEDFIYVSPLCEVFETEIFKHTHKYDNNDKDECGGQGAKARDNSRVNVDTSEELKKVVVWRGLKVGDDVLVLRTNKSQNYVLLCRVSKLDDRS